MTEFFNHLRQKGVIHLLTSHRLMIPPGPNLSDRLTWHVGYMGLVAVGTALTSRQSNLAAGGEGVATLR